MRQPSAPRRNRRSRAWLIGLAAVAALVSFSSGGHALRYIQLSREREALQTEVQELRQEILELRRQTIELEKDPEAIERVAREKYHMGKKNEVLFLIQEKK